MFNLHQLKRGFFASHKNDPGLKRLCHPSYIEIAINKRNEYANEIARSFFKDLQNGTLILLPLNPPGNAVRHLKDLNQARLLIAKVDAEKGINENLLLSSQQNGVFAQFVPVKNSDGSITTLGGIELLNVMITYLWDVHAINYYRMAELGNDLITLEENNLAAAEVEETSDSVWQGRLQAGDPLNVIVGKYKMECLVNRNLCGHFAIVENEKGDGHIKIIYVCNENSCGKCCKSYGDIIAHFHDEHSGVVEGYSAEAREEIYLENYMNDPFAPCTVNYMN